MHKYTASLPTHRRRSIDTIGSLEVGVAMKLCEEAIRKRDPRTDIQRQRGGGREGENELKTTHDYAVTEWVTFVRIFSTLAQQIPPLPVGFCSRTCGEDCEALWQIIGPQDGRPTARSATDYTPFFDALSELSLPIFVLAAMHQAATLTTAAPVVVV